MHQGLMFAHDYADLGDVRLHYVSEGTGGLVLFLHGFPEFWYGWKAQLEDLGRDHHAVAPDMRGYNLSSKPEGVEHYQLHLLVQDVHALAKKLGHERFSLVGHDWGGVVAWAYAIAHPETLDRLVIINAPHPAVFQRELRDNSAQQKASEYMLMFRGDQAEDLLSANGYGALVQAVMGEGLATGVFTEDDREAYIEAWSQPGALTGGLNYYRAARVGPASEPGGSVGEFAGASFVVTVPTLVIWGERDTALLTGNLDGLDDYVKDLTIKRIANGTHWVVHEKPALVTQLIREYIDQA